MVVTYSIYNLSSIEQLNQQTDKTGTEDLSFLKGASPIYVTSLGDNNLTTTGSNINSAISSSEANNNTTQSKITSSLTNQLDEKNIGLPIITDTTSKVDITNKVPLNGNISSGNLLNGVLLQKEVDNLVNKHIILK